jgi:hypothetical protein
MADPGGFHMKKYFLAVLLLLVPLASAQYTVFDADGDSDITAGEEITFQYNTSESSNYTVDVLDSEDEVIVSGLELDLVFNSTQEGLNDTFYVYEANYQLSDSARVGEWESNLFDGFAQVETVNFQVVAEELRVIEIEDSPFFKNPQDRVEISAEVTNVEESVDDIQVSLNRSSKTPSMNLESPGYNIEVYSYNFGKLAHGSYEYVVDLVGSDGTTNSVSGSFNVYSSDRDADRSEVTVGISSLCSVNVRRFRPPGGGIMPVNGTGSFVMDINNNATAQANVSGELWVTYENETRWEEEDGYDELGEPLNLSYEPIEISNLTSGQTITASRSFNDTDEIGYYSGHLNISAQCRITEGSSQDPISDIQYYENEVHNSFRVLIAGGGSGGQGNPVANRTNPEDSNTSGEESNNTIEGDNANPGETPIPEPVPEPVPEPEPDPVPQLSLNIEAWNSSTEIPRGGYSRINLDMENFGEENINDINVSVMEDALPGDWEARGTSVANLSVNESVNRSIFIRPSEDVDPGTYRLSMLGSIPERDLDIERVELVVTEEVVEISQLKISEVPEVVRVTSGGSQEVPLLVRNIGGASIENSTVEVQNLEDCGRAQPGSISNIGANESASLSFNLTASSNIQECNSTIIVSTSDGSYSFANVRFEVTPDEGIVPPELRFPVFAIAWTVLLIVYSITMTRLHLDTLKLRIPYVILIVGEAAILVYVSSLYGVIPPELLPF